MKMTTRKGLVLALSATATKHAPTMLRQFTAEILATDLTSTAMGMASAANLGMVTNSRPGRGRMWWGSMPACTLLPNVIDGVFMTKQGRSLLLPAYCLESSCLVTRFHTRLPVPR